jgi:hypothetical protein
MQVAVRLGPGLPKPYNQLAITSLYCERYLDATYYFTRCLSAKQPINTARDGLLHLFEKV